MNSTLSQINWTSLTGCSHITGFNYQPSWGASGAVIWGDAFSADRFVWELACGKEHFPDFNCVRLWLSKDAYRHDSAQFMDNLQAGMQACVELDLAIIPTLFSVWRGDPEFDWTSPDQIIDTDYEELFAPYIEEVVASQLDNHNILAWDLCNEPVERKDVMESPRGPAQVAWLEFVGARVRQVDPEAKITIGWAFDSGWGRPWEPICDLLTPHIYGYPSYRRMENPPPDFPAYLDGMITDYLADLRERGVQKPVLSSETCWGSLDDLERAEMIRVSLSALVRHGIGFMPHALFTSPVADLHPPEMGVIRHPGNLAFIQMDGTLRPGHEVYNEYCQSGFE